MLQSYNDKSCCVVDNRYFPETAVALSKHFGETFYHSECRRAWPKSEDRLPGDGVKGVTRINDVDDPAFQKKVDLWVFPDLYWSGYQAMLRSQGKRVWGSGYGEELELHRNESKAYLKKLGLPVGDYEVIKGIDALREYLKSNNDVFVKISITRGDFETKHSRNYAYIEPWLNNLQHSMGMRANNIEFIVEQKIDAVAEVGYDGYNVYGQWPKEALIGLEVKDKSYIGHVNEYAKMPYALTEFTESIAETLEHYDYANFLSTENRIVEGGKSYMNDACCRQGSPPSELYLNMFKNLPDIMWYGAEGRLIDPEWSDQWGAEVIIDSSWHDDKFWQHVQFPEAIRDNVKLHQFTVIDGEYYVLPLENSSVGAAVATGETMDEARKNVQKICEQIEGDYLEIHADALDEAEEAIEKLKQAGVEI